jgi:hypothetical protein
MPINVFCASATAEGWIGVALGWACAQAFACDIPSASTRSSVGRTVRVTEIAGAGDRICALLTLYPSL